MPRDKHPGCLLMGGAYWIIFRFRLAFIRGGTK